MTSFLAAEFIMVFEGMILSPHRVIHLAGRPIRIEKFSMLLHELRIEYSNRLVCFFAVRPILFEEFDSILNEFVNLHVSGGTISVVSESFPYAKDPGS